VSNKETGEKRCLLVRTVAFIILLQIPKMQMLALSGPCRFILYQLQKSENAELFAFSAILSVACVVDAVDNSCKVEGFICKRIMS